jgi:type I restriction enzyme S subunit
MKTQLPQQEQEYTNTELGLLPNDWNVRKLGELSKLIVPQRNKPKKFDGSIPWIRIEDFEGKYLSSSKSNQKVSEEIIKKMQLRPYPKNSVLCSCSGNMGICAITKEVLITNQTFIGIVPNSNLDAEYLYYLLGFSKHRIEMLGIGVTIHYVSKNKFKTFEIPLPPLSEQKNIATVLSIIQDAQEKSENVINSLKELKKSLMKHLFTYGAVSFNDTEKVSLTKTKIGMIPDGWDVAKIGEISSFQGGFAFKSQDYSKSGIRLFRISNVSFGKVLWHDVVYLPENSLQKYKDFVLREGDLVMAMTRPIVSGGIKITKIGSNDAPCLLNQRVGRFLVDPSKIDTDFLFHVLFDKVFREAINAGAIGSEQPNISAKQVERIRILLPPLSEQQQIASILSVVDINIGNEERRKQALNELFNSMLSNLMGAKIRVNNLGA